MAATNINRVVLTGHLTRDPELRSTASGMSVCSLRIASNTRRKNQSTGEWEDKPNFFDVTVWGAQGENWGMRAGVISLVVIGFLGWVGHRAANGRKWAFVLGMVVYGIDGAIFLVIQDWIGVGFHAFALFMIFRGYQAARQLSA